MTMKTRSELLDAGFLWSVAVMGMATLPPPMFCTVAQRVFKLRGNPIPSSIRWSHVAGELGALPRAFQEEVLQLVDQLQAPVQMVLPISWMSGEERVWSWLLGLEGDERAS